MIKRIKSYMEEFKLQHVVKKEHVIFTAFDGDLEFMIRATDSWEDTKKRLDKFKEAKLRTSECQHCPICMTNNLDEGAAGCDKCSQSICLQCCFNSMRARRGNWTCPFCRHTTGNEIDDPEELDRLMDGIYRRFMHCAPMFKVDLNFSN